jgi:uncharacterized protein with ParB-like and HNH nuclease domain
MIYRILAIVLLASGIWFHGYTTGSTNATNACNTEKLIASKIATEIQDTAILAVQQENLKYQTSAAIVINQLTEIRNASDKRIKYLISKPQVVCDSRPVITDEWMHDFSTILTRGKTQTQSGISGDSPSSLP